MFLGPEVAFTLIGWWLFGEMSQNNYPKNAGLKREAYSESLGFPAWPLDQLGLWISGSDPCSTHLQLKQETAKPKSHGKKDVWKAHALQVDRIGIK